MREIRPDPSDVHTRINRTPTTKLITHYDLSRAEKKNNNKRLKMLFKQESVC